MIWIMFYGAAASNSDGPSATGTLSMKSLLLSFIFAILSTQVLAEGRHHATSRYIGEAGREVKSLSEADVDELTRGDGWGLAKPAELNGYPGPSHVLAMKNQIGLTDDQFQKVQQVFDLMQARASAEGRIFVDAERKLDAAFRSRTITETALGDLVAEAEASRSRLRFIHLAAHLEVAQVLDPGQIAIYEEHRGYSK
ncbi:Spy/CpxP family protein refolding chaperone [Rhizobium etli]|uniref:Spy/CpxP family protein refolding chaperone n=1 Tax=Rhizobium etli TaxID=29449 RepID=A0A7W6ZLM6_RHIET|nr:Spy/CpxP family protein refolding chaperone [Rhizobium etli]MBB4482273.1 Spy/CpxP family protein refolding chaperone [Rhizobium etli]MBB4538102.1 Spy/CpxP family protein refolding chaperone [Rhizobium etli]